MPVSPYFPSCGAGTYTVSNTAPALFAPMSIVVSSRRSRKYALVLIAGALSVACGGGEKTAGPLPIASVELITAKPTFEVGQSVQFTAVTRDRNGAPVPPGTVQWAVSPASVASVSSAGIVTALSAGSATVTATAGGVTGTFTATIVDAGIPAAATVFMPGNAFSPFSVTIRVQGTVTWEFPAEEHDVTFVKKAGVPADIPVRRNVSVGRVFTSTGTFPYECMVHPGMTGQVIVVP